MAGRARESAPLVVVWSLCTALVVPTGCAGAGDDKPATDGVHTGDSGAGNGGTDGGGGSAGSDDPIDTGDTGDTGTPGSGIGLPVEWDAADFLHVWDIGPGHPYETPGDAPWETLSASTLVRIHARSEPYTDKFVVAVTGTADDPVVILGVDGPVLQGAGATTRTELDYWNEDRALIKVGGSSSPSADVAHVHIQGLVLEGAHQDNTFVDDRGETQAYTGNAACIFVESGEHVTIRDNELRGCGNGLFVASASRDVLVAQNHIHGNGVVGSFYEHNSYTEAVGITFEYNRYGSLMAGADGNNLKDRSTGTIIRANWIEGGNRQLDLVEGGSPDVTGHADYGRTFVYGNILIEPDGDGNSQIVHYGGDSGDEDRYRPGGLHFYHNTVVSHRTGTTTLVRLSTAEQWADVRNNVVVVAGTLGITAETGDVSLHGNLLPTGWTDSHNGAYLGSVTDDGSGQTTADAGLDGDHRPTASSAAPGLAGPLAEGASAVDIEYVPHRSGQGRSDTSTAGAFSVP